MNFKRRSFQLRLLFLIFLCSNIAQAQNKNEITFGMTYFDLLRNTENIENISAQIYGFKYLFLATYYIKTNIKLIVSSTKLQTSLEYKEINNTNQISSDFSMQDFDIGLNYNSSNLLFKVKAGVQSTKWGLHNLSITKTIDKISFSYNFNLNRFLFSGDIYYNEFKIYFESLINSETHSIGIKYLNLDFLEVELSFLYSPFSHYYGEKDDFKIAGSIISPKIAIKHSLFKTVKILYSFNIYSFGKSLDSENFFLYYYNFNDIISLNLDSNIYHIQLEINNSTYKIKYNYLFTNTDEKLFISPAQAWGFVSISSSIFLPLDYHSLAFQYKRDISKKLFLKIETEIKYIDLKGVEIDESIVPLIGTSETTIIKSQVEFMLLYSLKLSISYLFSSFKFTYSFQQYIPQIKLKQKYLSLSDTTDSFYGGGIHSICIQFFF